GESLPLSLHDALPILLDFAALPFRLQAAFAGGQGRPGFAAWFFARPERLRQQLLQTSQRQLPVLVLAARLLHRHRQVAPTIQPRSEEHTSELKSRENL